MAAFLGSLERVNDGGNEHKQPLTAALTFAADFGFGDVLSVLLSRR